MALVGSMALVACQGGGGPEQKADHADPRHDVPYAKSAKAVRLEILIREMAHSNGCNAVEECQTVALGSTLCNGGAREYVVFCSRTTERAQLNAALAELNETEKQLGADWHRGITCVPQPPKMQFISGVCQARLY
jgi:hypothetical protein